MELSHCFNVGMNYILSSFRSLRRNVLATLLKRFSCVGAITVLATGLAFAEPVPVQMVVATAIQQASNPSILEGEEIGSAGAIYFPDVVLAAEMTASEGDAAALHASWSKTHRFLIVPFGISVLPEGDRIPQQVDVSLVFDGLGDLTQQPIVNDVFPPNGFKKAPFEGTASVSVSGDGAFSVTEDVNAGLSASAGFSYKYSPAYAHVISGYSSGVAFWKFIKTQDSYPVGNIPMKMLIIVPKTYAERELFASFDVRVDFGGYILSRGNVVANFTSKIMIPE